MKVVLLAGGYGTRLSEETVIKPKPMVEIGDKPILWHIMKIYWSYGFNDFEIALGYKGELIKEFFLNYKLHTNDMKIHLSNGEVEFKNNCAEDWHIGLHDTGTKSMTGGRLFRLKNLFNKGDTLMLTYGDGVADVNINELLDFHFAHGKIATLTAVRPPARFGSVEMDSNGLVSEFKEKPQIGEGWINGGFFVFDYKIFEYLFDENSILERYPMEKLAEEQQLVAYKHEGFWQCMDTIRDRDSLNEIWLSGNAPWKKW